MNPPPGPHLFNTRQLRALCLLDSTGSFSSTARNLEVTASAISHAIKSLETDCGLALIERLGHAAVPTGAGKILIAHARSILTEMTKTRQEIRRLARQEEESRIGLGATAAACQYLLPAVLREFTRRFPHSKVEVHCGGSPTCREAVMRGGLDLALCERNSGKGHPTRFRGLFSEEIRLAVPPGHRWGKPAGIPLAELVREPLIWGTTDSSLPRLVNRYLPGPEPCFLTLP